MASQLVGTDGDDWHIFRRADAPRRLFTTFFGWEKSPQQGKLGMLLLAAMAKRVENTEQYLGKITMQWHDIHILNGYI